MMKTALLLFASIVAMTTFGQSLQLHYDLRRTVDPAHNSKNFPTFYFEYFKQQDSGQARIKPGSFLLKMQADFSGEKNNMGKYYMQVSQTFRAWRPNIFVNLQYSGGLGITEPRAYSYYITNTYLLGIAYPFRWKDAYMSAVINYKFLPYPKPSHDAFATLYWWKGLFSYKAEFSGDFSIWTENQNHGDDFTKDLTGKRFYFFAEPQGWYNFSKRISVGIKLNMNYHVLTNENLLQVNPSIGIRCKY